MRKFCAVLLGLAFSVQTAMPKCSDDLEYLKGELGREKRNSAAAEEVIDKMIADGRNAITESGITIPQTMTNWEMFTYVVRELKKKHAESLAAWKKEQFSPSDQTLENLIDAHVNGRRYCISYVSPQWCYDDEANVERMGLAVHVGIDGGWKKYLFYVVGNRLKLSSVEDIFRYPYNR